MDNPTRTCSIDGCDRRLLSRGWCSMHYARWRNHGDPGRAEPQLNNDHATECNVEGCDREYYARGLCAMHYARLLRLGDVGGAESSRKPPGTPCSIEDCDREHFARGWCRFHYGRWQQGVAMDAPERRQYETPEESLAARTERQGDCLVWLGGLNQSGYGSVTVNGKKVSVHRFAWEQVNGPIPDGQMIDHICHNRACVEIAHLRLASFVENTRNRRGAQSTSRIGVRNVRLTPKGNYQVRITKDDVRYHFGMYESLEEAKAVAERERKRLFGDFAGAA